jgi:polyhydroxyalkanoate synthesis regulator phasin
MLDAVRKYVEAGREALTPKKAEELARSLVKQGEVRREQAARLTADLLEWSRRNSERLRSTIAREVKKQLGRAGLATKAEVEALRRRVRKLESSRKTGTTRKRASSSKSSG